MTSLERDFALGPFCELRLVTALVTNQPTKVILRKRGDDESTQTAARADIFGTELIAGVPVQLPPGRSTSIFTPTGCTISVVAPPTVLQRCYATAVGGTWMRSLLDLHTLLERQRREARGTDDAGPRVLFLSDRHCTGASTYIRWLVNFAVRLGYHPLLVDGVLDTPCFGYPSCLALYHMQHCIDIEEETNYQPALHALVGPSRDGNPGLYHHWVGQLLHRGLEKMASNERCRVGGLFYDYGVIEPHTVEVADAAEAVLAASISAPAPDETPPSRSVKHPIDTLLDTVVAADIDHICVVGSSWLRTRVEQRARERFGMGVGDDRQLGAPAAIDGGGGQQFKLLLVDAVELVRSFPSSLLNRQKWLRYFFGSPTSPVKPTLITVAASQIRLATVGSTTTDAMTTLLPMMDSEEGQRMTVDAAAISYFTLQDVPLKDRIVAIASAAEYERGTDGELFRVPFGEFERGIREGSLRGFALVESLSSETMTLLIHGTNFDKELGLCLLLTEEVLKSGTA